MSKKTGFIIVLAAAILGYPYLAGMYIQSKIEDQFYTGMALAKLPKEALTLEYNRNWFNSSLSVSLNIEKMLKPEDRQALDMFGISKEINKLKNLYTISHMPAIGDSGIALATYNGSFKYKNTAISDENGLVYPTKISSKIIIKPTEVINNLIQDYLDNNKTTAAAQTAQISGMQDLIKNNLIFEKITYDSNYYFISKQGDAKLATTAIVLKSMANSPELTMKPLNGTFDYKIKDSKNLSMNYNLNASMIEAKQTNSLLLQIENLNNSSKTDINNNMISADMRAKADSIKLQYQILQPPAFNKSIQQEPNVANVELTDLMMKVNYNNFDYDLIDDLDPSKKEFTSNLISFSQNTPDLSMEMQLNSKEIKEMQIPQVKIQTMLDASLNPIDKTNPAVNNPMVIFGQYIDVTQKLVVNKEAWDYVKLMANLEPFLKAAEFSEDIDKDNNISLLLTKKGAEYQLNNKPLDINKIMQAVAAQAQQAQVRQQQDYMNELQKQADQNDPAATNDLGYYYNNVVKDHTKAFEAYKKAYELNDTLANFNLAEAYEAGSGTQPDLNKAITLYQEGVSKNNEGSANCAYALGRIYSQGNSILEKDLDKARQYFEQAAKLARNKESFGKPVIDDKTAKEFANAEVEYYTTGNLPMENENKPNAKLYLLHVQFIMMTSEKLR